MKFDLKGHIRPFQLDYFQHIRLSTDFDDKFSLNTNNMKTKFFLNEVLIKSIVFYEEVACFFAFSFQIFLLQP